MNVHEISSASPDMSDAETAALRESIATIGQQVPILVWRGDVIDGRKRLAACQSLGIEPKVQTMPDDGDPALFAEALNLLRTHYSHGQRAMYASALATASGAGRPRNNSGNSQNFVSQRQAAKLAGVEQSSVAAAKRVRATAAPEVVQAVERGALTLNAAKQIADKVPLDEQPQILKRVVEAKKGKRNTPAKIINAAAPGLRRTVRRDVTVVRGRALRTMAECAAVLDQFMEYDVAPQSDVKQWSEWIGEATDALRTFNKKLEAARVRSA